MGSVTGAGVAEVTNQLDFDDEVGFQAIRKMRDLARSKDRRPWFLTVSFTHPHDPYVTRRRFWDLYDDDSIPMPAVTEVDDPDPHSLRIAAAIEADRVHPDEEAVRTARHAYLANVSYVDSLVGELLETMDRLGMGDDTTVVFTSDHGDMLGERGLWYKMSFFEHSARVPLVLRSSGLSPSVVDTPVSHLDLLPTLLDLVEVDPNEETIGSSLVGVADGTEPDRTVVGEYMAEGSVAPMFMIRRGAEKFVWSEPDPPQLYDLGSDPHELVNLAPTSPKTTLYEAELHERWDVEAIDHSVRRSQTERHLVAHANRQGRYTPWEHQPRVDASEQYMRNHLDLNEVESGRRF
jgi:choline-sulfatase